MKFTSQYIHLLIHCLPPLNPLIKLPYANWKCLITIQPVCVPLFYPKPASLSSMFSSASPLPTDYFYRRINTGPSRHRLISPLVFDPLTKPSQHLLFAQRIRASPAHNSPQKSSLSSATTSRLPSEFSRRSVNHYPFLHIARVALTLPFFTPAPVSNVYMKCGRARANQYRQDSCQGCTRNRLYVLVLGILNPSAGYAGVHDWYRLLSINVIDGYRVVLLVFI